jgi:hypothetical protein
MAQSRKPFLPEDLRRNGRPGEVLARMAMAEAQSQQQRVPIENFTHGDEPVRLLQRAASAPAALATDSWAGYMAREGLVDVITSGPAAISEILKLSVPIPFDGNAKVRVPGIGATADDVAGFLGEGDAFPVGSLNVTDGCTLTPTKLGRIIAFSNEVFRYSNAVDVFRRRLSRAWPLALDKEIFSSTAASSARPAGLQAGLSPIPAASAGADAWKTDLRALMDALVAAGGGNQAAFVCAPGQALTLKASAGAKFDYPIFASRALAARTVVALDVGSFVFAIDPVPQFLLTDAAVMHTDTAAGQLVTGGVVSSPLRSLWQTDGFALKAIIRCSFGMVAPHVAVVTNTNW